MENNDNTIIPTVNLVFDNDKLPIISNIQHDTNFIYTDESFATKTPNDLFIQEQQQHYESYTFGSLMTDPLSLTHTIDTTNTDHHTSYIFDNPTPQTSKHIPLTDHISTAIDPTQSNGLYEFQINTQIQNDSGANRSVTNLISLLHNFKTIDPYPIGGVNSQTPAIYCTGFGHLKWYSEDKQVIQIPCYYCAESSGTIISPTDIVYTHMDNFKGWQMTTNIDSKTGTFILIARDGINHIKYPTFMRNNL